MTVSSAHELIKKIFVVNKNKELEDYRFGDIVFHKGWPPDYNEWEDIQKNIVSNHNLNNTILKKIY